MLKNKTIFVSVFILFNLINNFSYSFDLNSKNSVFNANNSIFSNNYASDLENNNDEEQENNNKVDDKNRIFYNEKYNNETTKNYSKIGVEEYTQNSIWRKYYSGISFDWWFKKFGTITGSDRHVNITDFFRRFQNLNVYFGARFYRFFGAEIGYTHFGNVLSKEGKKNSIDGFYITSTFFTPMVDLKYTNIEGYLNIGFATLFTGINNMKPNVALKVGGGAVLQVYGPISFNVGIDYYYPIKCFAEKGFITFKTGLNVYLNI